MTTLFATSPDGLKIAYDRIGTGPALVLLHGGGGSRQVWHEVGYVKRLQDAFTVIPIDLRGHGESDAPTEPGDYTIDKMMQDVLAVADACGVECFTLWGHSFGGKVGRHIAAHSRRVAKIVLMGSPLGNYISPQFRKEIKAFPAHWLPIIQAQRNGTLDLDSLSRDDRELWEDTNVPAMLGWGPAMLNWPPVEPADFHCPVLWLVGSEDSGAMVSVRKYKSSLEDTLVQLHILDGLDHFQVFQEIDASFAPMLAFTLLGGDL
jgi:pimeloyl-ACP methyl ester carboxylesterase